MAYSITTRDPHRLQLKFCNLRNMPTLFAIARPLATQKCFFDIGDKDRNSYPVIRTQYERNLLTVWTGPWVFNNEASIQTFNGTDFFVLGASAPLCQQRALGASVSLVPHSQLSVSSTQVNNDTIVTVNFNFGAQFSNGSSFVNSWTPLPPDAIVGNTPALYNVLLFSGEIANRKQWWTGTVKVSVNEGPTGPPKLCDSSFGPASSSPTGQTQTGMGNSGGAS